MTESLERRKKFGDVAKDIAKRFLRHENAVLVMVLVALIAGVAVMSKGASIQRVNVFNVISQSSMRGIAAIGQAFVILTAGIDVSVEGVAVLCSILGAALMTSVAERSIVSSPLPLVAAIPIMLLVGAGWGAINGSAVSRIGMPALIVTLAMWQVIKGVAFQICHGRFITNLPEGTGFFAFGRVAGVPVPLIIFFVVAVVAHLVLTYTTYGKSIYATGGNPVAAWLCGIDVKKILFSVYVISGFLTALAAVIYTSLGESASMITAQGLLLDHIAAVFVGGVSLMGGKGTILGVVLGTLIIGVTNNLFSFLGALPALQSMTKGGIIIAAVAVDYIRRR